MGDETRVEKTVEETTTVPEVEEVRESHRISGPPETEEKTVTTTEVTEEK